MRPLTTGPCDPLRRGFVKINSVEVFFSATLFEPCGAVFIMNSKNIWGKIAQTSTSKPFRIISVFIIGPSVNGVFFFFAAVAEVQVTFLSVLNLPRQGFPGTYPIGHCCASEILCDSPTYNKQRMNKMSQSRWHGRVAWKPKMHDDVMLNGVFRICLWLVARQLRIPNR